MASIRDVTQRGHEVLRDVTKRAALLARIATAQRMAGSQQHPRPRGRAAIHAPHTLGERIADAVVAGMGSWRFIIIQTVIVACWISANVIGLMLRFDPFPFILLNLVFSTQAAYASPLILMAANRSAAKDHQRDDLEAQEVDELLALNRQQLAMLQKQDETIRLLRQSLPSKPPATTRTVTAATISRKRDKPHAG